MTRKTKGLFSDLEWRFIELISLGNKIDDICSEMKITRTTYYQKLQQIGLKIYLHWQDHKKLKSYTLAKPDIEVETDITKAKKQNKVLLSKTNINHE